MDSYLHSAKMEVSLSRGWLNFFCSLATMYDSRGKNLPNRLRSTSSCSITWFSN